MLLPWEYGVRNLSRRPLRTVLTLVALATVVMLLFAVVGFIRGLERSLANSGDPDVVLVYSVNALENLETSAIAARTPNLLSASLDGTRRRFGVEHISPELFLGTRVTTSGGYASFGLVRGVTTSAPLVRRNIRLTEGDWPDDRQVIVGNLVAAKLGCDPDSLRIGQQLEIEGTQWTIRGVFTAMGGAGDSEIWCNLENLQSATKRQDLSLVAMLLKPGASSSEVELFCKERTDLELRAISETAYFEELQNHYRPVRILGWLVVFLVASAGVFAGLNMMYGAVAGRVREIATLQAMGYRRRAILLSLIQEGVLLAAAGSLVSGLIALLLLNGIAVRFTMGAFTLRIDSFAILTGCGIGLLLGLLGAIPPGIKALRGSVSENLKAI